MSNFFKGLNKRNIYFYMSIIGSTILIFLTVFLLADIYYKNKAKEIDFSTVNQLVQNDNNSLKNSASLNIKNTDQVSSSLDKNIDNIQNVNILENESKIENVSSVNNENKVSKEITENTVENISKEDENLNAEDVAEMREFKVLAPVEGEIVKDFAMESLLYSETLKEWTTHLGIDIKADKTTVVKCGYNGVVESIKNDPRFGLTITINHENGYKTVYSNLLTTEFVSEGETVEEGKTIATVGESASFESLEEPHLHFEILKDNVNVNPTLYLK